MSTAFFKMPRQSMSKPVPSERRMSQKKRTTRPCAGRHGRSDMVEVSGTKKSSLSASFSKPMMREASMGMPPSNAEAKRLG